MILRFLCVYVFVAAALTLRGKGYEGNSSVKYWNLDAEGVWCFVATPLLVVLQKKDWICVGDLTLMIPVNPGISWKITKRSTKARYACSVLRLLDLAFSWENVKTVGKTSPIVVGIHSFKFRFQKVLITLLWKSAPYLLLLGLCGTSVCLGLKLHVLYYQSLNSLLCFHE